MKQAAQSGRSQASNATERANSRPAQPRQQAVAPGGHLAQLAATMNSSSRVQGLMGLAAQFNQSASARLSSVAMNGNAGEKYPIQGKFLLKDPKNATEQMQAAVKLFMAAIRALNGELVQLIDSSDDINVIIDPGTAFGVAGSGETKLERQTNKKGAPEAFADTLSEIVSTTKVTDEMRTQPLVLRIKVNQKGLSGWTEGSTAQLAETLAHEYSLHAEAQLEAIKALRDPSLNNKQALAAIVASSNDRGGFNNADAQHAELTSKKGSRYDAMLATINEMKRNLTATDAANLQKAFDEDIQDRH